MAQPWLESTKPFIKGSEKCQRKLKSRECEAGREQADPSTGNAGLEPGPAWGLAGLGSGLRAGSWFPREIKVSWANTREKKLPWKGRIQSAASNPRKSAPSGLQNHGICEYGKFNIFNKPDLGSAQSRGTEGLQGNHEPGDSVDLKHQIQGKLHLLGFRTTEYGKYNSDLGSAQSRGTGAAPGKS